ncbi:MAG TPA: glycine--tRNA ligase subunit beta [Sphingomonadaceae bacterium]|nr:glycine--tRNA ligase subunit beta [Sphingomonadaceae bacterium]
MPDFLLELRSEEIPARMQAKARADLARLFTEQLAAAGLAATALETHATPRRLALIARGLPQATQATAEEIKGPRADAPPQALAGFLGKVGLTRDQLVERTDAKGNTVLFAVIERPGRPTTQVLAEAVPAIVRAFPWPKSMRWGAPSISTESPRWVRPLQGIVALFGEEIVSFEIAGITSGAATLGHRFHHPGIITIGSADDYEAKLRACHVILDADERATIIREGARAAAAAAGLTLVEDEALVAENAGLTEWPVPLLGRFDPAFLDVPREVIQLTMRTNQKYFACLTSSPAFAGKVAAQGADGGASSANLNRGPHQSTTLMGNSLAPAFICTANIAATDGGAAIVAGNERVLSARLSDAKFFWEADLKVPLEDQARKLADIVFHEKLGTLADKVDRVAKLARWLVEEGIVGSEPVRPERSRGAPSEDTQRPSTSLGTNAVEALATLTERAARLCKADLVTQSVGEFPELQGVLGAHLARAQGEDPQVCDAIRDHYKPVGQGDDVPTAPVTVAVSLADKLDTIVAFFTVGEVPSGSRDPFALRRAALAAIRLITHNKLRLNLRFVLFSGQIPVLGNILKTGKSPARQHVIQSTLELLGYDPSDLPREVCIKLAQLGDKEVLKVLESAWKISLDFFADRLKVQQREAGVRHDLIDAVFALGGEDDLVRLLARVHALQAFVETSEGRDLLAGYKRAANILRKEGYSPVIPANAGTQEHGTTSPDADADTSATLGPGLRRDDGANIPLSYTPEPVEQSLIAALDSAEPRARAAIAAEDFAGAMTALASLRAPVDAFFDKVTVNDPEPAKRAARLALLARLRDAVHAVADFSKIEG